MFYLPSLCEYLTRKDEIHSQISYNHSRGPLAQWLELPAHNRSVAGSSPAGSTIPLMAQ